MNDLPARRSYPITISGPVLRRVGLGTGSAADASVPRQQPKSHPRMKPVVGGGPPGTCQKELVHLWRSRCQPGVELKYMPRSTRLWTVAHTAYDICCTVSLFAQVVCRVRRETYTIGQGRLHLFEPGQVHTTVSMSAPTDYVVLSLQPSALRAVLRERGSRWSPETFRSGRVVDGWLQSSLWQLWCAARSSDRRETAFHTQLSAIVERVMERHGRGSEPPESRRYPACCIDVVRDYLHTHLDFSVRLADCAAKVGLTTSHLCHAFKAEFGVTIAQYHAAVRMGHAREMLRSGQRPVEVAARLGFGDQAHFTRLFGQELGLTPSQYRLGR